MISWKSSENILKSDSKEGGVTIHYNGELQTKQRKRDNGGGGKI
jgi:hypothetical protein